MKSFAAWTSLDFEDKPNGNQSVVYGEFLEQLALKAGKRPAFPGKEIILHYPPTSREA